MENIVIPIITALFGYLIARLQFSERNRRIFRNAASSVLDDIKKAEGNSVTTVYEDSVPRLRHEISRVREDIWRWRRRRFDTAWDSYCEEHKVPLNVHIEEIKRGEFVAYQLGHFEEGRKRLEDLLCELMKCAR